MPKKRKQTLIGPHDRNHPDHSQEVIDLVDALARDGSGGTWPDEVRERKTRWRKAYTFYQLCLYSHRGDVPEPTAGYGYVYTADLKHYRRPYPKYVPPGQCRGDHFKSSVFYSGQPSVCTCRVDTGTENQLKSKQ